MKKSYCLLLLSIIAITFTACKGKKKTKEEDKFFPVLAFIKSQVAHVDTSLYNIRKVIYIDTARRDTAFYKREQFRELAADFLNLPDLAEPKYEDRFTETRTYDTTIRRAIYTYEPVKPEKETIQNQQVLIRLGDESNQITSIIIDYFTNNKDSSVEKRLLWQTDRSFQVTTTKQLRGKQETTTTYKVIWGREEENE